MSARHAADFYHVVEAFCEQPGLAETFAIHADAQQTLDSAPRAVASDALGLLDRAAIHRAIKLRAPQQIEARLRGEYRGAIVTLTLKLRVP